MEIRKTTITIREQCAGYVNDTETDIERGVWAYGGKLCVRPEFQRFFVYDDNKHRYVQIDSTIHIIKLSHFVERANDYHLFDENIKDTIEIHLDEIKKK